MKTRELPVEMLRLLLMYNPETGVLKWNRENHSRLKTGKLEAGSISEGYVCIMINGKSYKGHNLAWAIHYGEHPPKGLFIDHEDRNRSNNKISNLRLLTERQNSQNKTRKHKYPLYIYPHRARFVVRISINGKIKNFGNFSNVEEATQKRNIVIKELNIQTIT